MAALPYMQFYPAEYLADTAHLSTESHGAYLLLIFNYWQTGKAIKKKHAQSIARVLNERWTDVEQDLEELFDSVEKDGDIYWLHKRIEADLLMVAEAAEKKSAAGKASAAAKRAKQQADLKKKNNTSSTPVQQHEDECSTNKSSNSNSSSNSNNKKNKQKKSAAPLTDTSSACGLGKAYSGKPKPKPKSLAEKFKAPPDVTREQWQAYLEARKYKGRPMTTGALELFVTAFVRTGESTGIDKKTLIEQATIGGWQTIKPEYVTDQLRPIGRSTPANTAARAASIVDGIGDESNPMQPPQRTDYLEGELA